MSWRVSGSRRVADPISFFPQWGSAPTALFQSRRGGIPIEVAAGEAELFRVRRININDVAFHVETPDGPVEETVQGNVDIRLGDSFARDQHASICRATTNMGLDVLPGTYTADVSYSTPAGSGTDRYDIDAR